MNKEFKQVNIWLWSLDSLSSPTFMVMKNCQVIRAHLCWSWYTRSFTSIIAVAYIKLSWLEFCLLYFVPEYFLSPSLFPFFSPSNIIFTNVIYYSHLSIIFTAATLLFTISSIQSSLSIYHLFQYLSLFLFGSGDFSLRALFHLFIGKLSRYCYSPLCFVYYRYFHKLSSVILTQVMTVGIEFSTTAVGYLVD